MNTEDFLKKHNARRVEDLNHELLLSFAQECMDVVTKASIKRYIAGNSSGIPNSMKEKLDKAIIEAFNHKMSVTIPFIVGESCDGENLDGKPGYRIILRQRL